MLASPRAALTAQYFRKDCHLLFRVGNLVHEVQPRARVSNLRWLVSGLFCAEYREFYCTQVLAKRSSFIRTDVADLKAFAQRSDAPAASPSDTWHKQRRTPGAADRVSTMLLYNLKSGPLSNFTQDSGLIFEAERSRFCCLVSVSKLLYS